VVDHRLQHSQVGAAAARVLEAVPIP